MGVLILSGAVNTSIIGANGVLNRVAEDGVLLDWFRKPHKRFGTTYRIINMIALLQVATIIAQPRRCLSAGRSVRVRRGVEFLPEIVGRAGAALPAARSGIQVSVQFSARRASRSRSGLGVTTLVLGFVAVANLFSKQIRDHLWRGLHAGCVRRVHDLRARQRQEATSVTEEKPLEEFNLDHQPQVNAATLARASRLRAGGRPRLSQHGAPEEGARKRPICAATTLW